MDRSERHRESFATGHGWGWGHLTQTLEAVKWLHVDAPDGPGPPANFNVSVWQGGAPTGGVTVTITRGGP